MHRIAPFALLAALLATAGSGLALIEAIGEVASFAEVSTGEAADYAAYFVNNPDQAPGLVEVAVSNAIFLKSSGEAMALATANAVVQDPMSPWTFARSWSDMAYAAAWTKADMAQAVAGNFYETANAVAELEMAAVGSAPEAALSCSAAARPLACAEDFVHSVVDA